MARLLQKYSALVPRRILRSSEETRRCRPALDHRTSKRICDAANRMRFSIEQDMRLRAAIFAPLLEFTGRFAKGLDEIFWNWALVSHGNAPSPETGRSALTARHPQGQEPSG